MDTRYRYICYHIYNYILSSVHYIAVLCQVYWRNGAQIIPPHDREIAQCITESLQLDQEAWDLDILLTSKYVEDPFNEIYEWSVAYLTAKENKA